MVLINKGDILRCRINRSHITGGQGFLNVQMYHPDGYYDPTRGIHDQRMSVDEMDKRTDEYIRLAGIAGWSVEKVA